MKPLLLLALACLTLASGCASSRKSGGGAATVQFIEPQRFTDFVEAGAAPANQDRLMRNLDDFIQRTGRQIVPAGQTLELDITDIDLPGQMSRGPRSTRVIRGNESAQVRLNYRLLDAGGDVRREGSERLTRNPTSLGIQRSFDRDRNLKLVADAIRAWMRRVVDETASPAA